MAWGAWLTTRAVLGRAYKADRARRKRKKTLINVQDGMRQTGQKVMKVTSQASADAGKVYGTAKRTKSAKKTLGVAAKTKTAGDTYAGMKRGVNWMKKNPKGSAGAAAAGGGGAVVLAGMGKKKKKNGGYV